MALACWPSFLGGALLLLAIEVVLGIALVSRLLQNLREGSREARAAAVSSASEAALAKQEVDQPPSPRASSSGSVVLQGVVWVASEPRDHGRKPPREKQKRRESWKDLAEVNPVWRRGKLLDRALILTASDGVEDTILLEGCNVVAVSGSAHPGRKWAKRYPVKLHHNRRLIYDGSSACLLYFNTGWEKEAWCECLRGAAKLEYDADDWYLKLKKEFDDYSIKVSNQQPFYTDAVASQRKTTGGETDSASKKRRFFWKRLTKRNSKNSKDVKAVLDSQFSSVSTSKTVPDGEEKSRGRRTSDGSSKAILAEKTMSLCTSREGPSGSEEMGKSASMPDLQGENMQVEVVGPQKNFEEAQVLADGRSSVDRGLLCWNMIISRMFFDIYHSTDVTGFVQQRIQKLLTSKSANPGYIGALICTHLDLGTCPPLAHGMKVLPVDSDGVWALEADLEYYGGAVLTVETRLDLRDPKDQERVANKGLEPTLAGAATADLLAKGLASLGEDLEIAGSVEVGTPADRKDVDASKLGSSRRNWVQSSIASCKSMLKNVAEQVSQVPLTLSVKVVSLKGTLCVRFRPPPSDRVWLGFTSMPSLEMESEPCIGDHKISSGPIAAFIVERIKVLLREALVLPQCEDIHLPWMVTDNDNWVPQTAAPFSWSGPVQNGESTNNVANVDSANLPLQSRDKVLGDSVPAPSVPAPSVPAPTVDNVVGLQSFASIPQQSQSQMDSSAMVVPIMNSAALGNYDGDLRMPLLGNEAGNGNGDPHRMEAADASISFSEQYSDGEASSRSLGPADGAEQTLGRAGSSRRTKVLNLGKRLGVKFEDKRKHVLDRIRERRASGGVSEFTVDELTDGKVS